MQIKDRTSRINSPKLDNKNKRLKKAISRHKSSATKKPTTETVFLFNMWFAVMM